jgi:hypothetical protein
MQAWKLLCIMDPGRKFSIDKVGIRSLLRRLIQRCVRGKKDQSYLIYPLVAG